MNFFLGASQIIGPNIALSSYEVYASHDIAPSYLHMDQQRIYSALDYFSSPAVADIKNGEIANARATHVAAVPARQMLEMVFEVDSRYSMIGDVSFAVNCDLETLVRNNAAIEVIFGGETSGRIRRERELGCGCHAA